MNGEGQTDINALDKGIEDLKQSIINGNISALSSNFKNVGAPGMMKLTMSTNNACLKQAFRELQKIDESIAIRLQSIRNPAVAAQLVCTTLNSKAQRLIKCK